LEKRGEGTPVKKEKLSVLYSGCAQIDKEYMPLVQDRLYFYQKISAATTVSEVSAVQNEIIDRFGPLREETINLFKIAMKSFIKYFESVLILLSLSPGALGFSFFLLKHPLFLILFLFLKNL